MKYVAQSSSQNHLLLFLEVKTSSYIYVKKSSCAISLLYIYTSLVFLICLSSKIGGALFFIQLPIYDMYYITMYILLCINEELMANPDFFVDNSIACVWEER